MLAPRLMSESESESSAVGECASRRELPDELASCDDSWCGGILQQARGRGHQSGLKAQRRQDGIRIAGIALHGIDRDSICKISVIA